MWNLLFCLLYTSDAADDLLCVDLGGRRIIKNKNPHSQGLRGFKGGPTWARTKDQMIMSHLL